MENGTTFQYAPIGNGTEQSQAGGIPTLPPLIKIDQTIPVGYTAILKRVEPVTSPENSHNHDNSSSSGSSDVNSEGKQPSPPQQSPASTDSGLAQYQQYRPTIINLLPQQAPPVTAAFSTSSPTVIHGDVTTPMARPLVEPIDSDRPERMRDWLVRMIESGRFPGLKWLDAEQTIFRVPWIHAKKRDYNQERDAALFREWAIHSGKYGDGSDVTTWKINFRCALNGLKDIVERRDLEEADCRVYQMLPSSNPSRRRKRRRPGGFYLMDGEMAVQQGMDKDVRSRVELPATNAVSGPLIGAQTPTLSSGAILTPTSGGAPLQLFPIVPAGTPLGTPTATPIRIVGSPTTPQNSQFGFLQKLKTIVPSNTNIISPVIPRHFDLTGSAAMGSPGSLGGSTQTDGSFSSHPPTPQTPLSPVGATQFSPRVISPPFTSSSSSASSCSTSVAITSHNMHSSTNQQNHTSSTTSTAVPNSSPTFPLHPSLHVAPVYLPPPEFNTNPNAVIIRIFYGSITVHLETLDCSKGTRIFYGPLHRRDILDQQVEEKLFGPLEAQQISLSPRHPAGKAREIFRSLKRGLVLEVENECIYATALCRTVVYYGNTPLKHTGTLHKEERTKVFNYNHRFLPSLKYTVDGRVQPPKPYAVLSLGQPWGGERPLAKNLVTIVVTYCKALHDLQTRQAFPIHDELLFEAQEARDIQIAEANDEDIEAEEFLNPSLGEVETPT